MQGKFPNADWNSIHTKVDQVLGDDFWQDISEMIPVLGPRVDVYETKQAVAVFVELPGILSTENIRISMNGTVLTISGEIESNYPIQQQQFLVAERFFGNFSRKITLPNIVYSDIRAKFSNGLLAIQLMKTAQMQEKTIDIEND